MITGCFKNGNKVEEIQNQLKDFNTPILDIKNKVRVKTQESETKIIWIPPYSLTVKKDNKRQQNQINFANQTRHALLLKPFLLQSTSSMIALTQQ